MKKRNIFVLCMVLCAMPVFVTISQAYALQEEAQLNETQNIIEPGFALEIAEQPVHPDAENDEDTWPISEQSAQPDEDTWPISEQSTQPDEDSWPTPELAEPDETQDVPENFAEAEPTPIPSNPLEAPEPEEDLLTDAEETEIKTEVETEIKAEVKSNPAVATEIELALDRLNTHVSSIASLIGAADNYTLTAGDDNFYEALAVYAMRHNQTENYPYGVTISNAKDSAEFQSIHWSLNPVSAAKTDNSAVIHISRLSVASVYSLTDSEIKIFDMLNSYENREFVRMLLLASESQPITELIPSPEVAEQPGKPESTPVPLPFDPLESPDPEEEP
ncbi:MAG: hypothetical protein LBL96_04860 [Clostridiales bacterium]|jgi:hypothetical protein|nr:hypothetical protein [Clostridiales bacterium]